MAVLANLGTKLAKGRAASATKLAAAQKGSMQNVGSKMGMGGKGFGLLLGGAFAVGMAQKTVDPAINAANDIAFGDPEADKYFMGSQGLSPGGIFDAKTGSGGGVAGTIGGAALGGIFGGIGAAAAGSTLKDKTLQNSLKFPEKMPGLGGKTILKGGKTAKMSGGKMGVAGAIVGAAVGASAMTKGFVNRNQEFYNTSPYAKGSAMQASSTQAYGDMVLGMHNSRRG
jgi:hypothetical protein